MKKQNMYCTLLIVIFSLCVCCTANAVPKKAVKRYWISCQKYSKEMSGFKRKIIELKPDGKIESNDTNDPYFKSAYWKYDKKKKLLYLYLNIDKREKNIENALKTYKERGIIVGYNLKKRYIIYGYDNKTKTICLFGYDFVVADSLDVIKTLP